MSDSKNIGSFELFAPALDGPAIKLLRSLYSAGLMTEGSIRSLGTANLSFLIARLRTHLKYENESIDDAASELSAVDGKTVAALTENADYAVNTAALAKGLPGELPDTQGFQSWVVYGHTNFLYCMSCAHGWLRDSGRIQCRLLARLDEEQDAPYDSSCVITSTMSDDGLNGLAVVLRREVKKLKTNRSLALHTMYALRDARRHAEHAPHFIEFRADESFKFGDRVFVYGWSSEFTEAAQGKWIPATILASGDSLVVRLDHPMIVPYDNKYEEKGRIPYFCFPRQYSPFVLHAEDFYSLLRRTKADVFRKLWFERFRGITRYDAEPIRWNRHHEEVDIKQYMRSFSARYVLAADETITRLMSAQEAQKILGLSSMPSSPDDVVKAYRTLKSTSADPQLVKAKDTLLLRFYGRESTAGGH